MKKFHYLLVFIIDRLDILFLTILLKREIENEDKVLMTEDLLEIIIIIIHNSEVKTILIIEINFIFPFFNRHTHKRNV